LLESRKAVSGAKSNTKGMPSPGNTYWRGRLSTVDLLIKVACFVKKINNVNKSKAADQN
jgi:hypothetical protein